MTILRNFARHVRDGFISVARHAAMSLSSASAVTLTLLLIAVFLVVSININSVTSNVESTVNIAAYVDWDYESDSAINEIKSKIEKIDGVANIVFSDKDTELNTVIESMGSEETRAVMEEYRGENNPLHDVFIVEVTDGSKIADVTSAIVAVEGIESADYGGDSTLMLMNVLDSVRLGVVILVASLSCLAVFLISNTIKLTIQARVKEIAIMRQVGAANSYIRAPFVIEGMIIGALGALIPIFVTVFGYIWIYQETGGFFLTRMFAMMPPHPTVLYIALILLGIGVVVGLIGSFMSVTKYLRWRR